MVSTQGFDPCNPGSSPGRTSFFRFRVFCQHQSSSWALATVTTEGTHHFSCFFETLLGIQNRNPTDGFELRMLSQLDSTISTVIHQFHPAQCGVESNPFFVHPAAIISFFLADKKQPPKKKWRSSIPHAQECAPPLSYISGEKELCRTPHGGLCPQPCPPIR